MFDWFKPRKPLSMIGLLVAEIDAFTAYHAVNPYSSDKSLVKLISLFDTLYDYRQALVRYQEYLSNDALVPRYHLRSTVKQIYLRDFFTHQNKFIDVPEELKSFFEISKDFLILYEQQEMLIDKSFNTEKNLLLLQSVVSNLPPLIRSLYA